MSHSYETVASILGPSSSTLADVNYQAKSVSSMDSKNKTVAPPDVSCPHFVDDATPIQKIESRSEDTHMEHNIEYPSSAEPYMWDLTGGRSSSPSQANDSDDGVMVYASMKKWPPLTEADITEISKDNGEVEEQQASQWHTRERLLSGQDSVQTAVNIESLVVSHKTETEQREVRAVSSLQLDKG